MNKIIKYAAVGIVGYFVGFYELKYKMTKALAQELINREQEDSKEEQEGEA